MMSGEDRPPYSGDFMKYIKRLEISLSKSVHTEVNAALAPFREEQKELKVDLSSTKSRVS